VDPTIYRFCRSVLSFVRYIVGTNSPSAHAERVKELRLQVVWMQSALEGELRQPTPSWLLENRADAVTGNHLPGHPRTTWHNNRLAKTHRLHEDARREVPVGLRLISQQNDGASGKVREVVGRILLRGRRPVARGSDGAVQADEGSLRPTHHGASHDAYDCGRVFARASAAPPTSVMNSRRFN
jgi:hypothetical protein